MKKIIALALIALMLAFPGCKEEEEQQIDMPENILDFENRPNSDLIPGGGVEEHGTVIEVDPDDGIPSEDELGEYEEIFLEGDVFEDGSRAGWVLGISLKDITVNTYNKITKYTLAGNAKNCVDHVKPGDAVLLSWFEADDGTFIADNVSRVRVEDEPLTKEEIAEMYKEAEQQLEGSSAVE